MKTPIAFLAVLVLSACAPTDYRDQYTGPPTPTEAEAGPLRSNDDARAACPSVCGARGWAGTWRRIEGHQALCGCSAPAAAVPAEVLASPAVTAPTACTVQGNDACAGCAVSCPAGQQASCAEGVARQTSMGGAVCESPARCMCH